jgi:hypothetical protein
MSKQKRSVIYGAVGESLEFLPFDVAFVQVLTRDFLQDSQTWAELSNSVSTRRLKSLTSCLKTSRGKPRKLSMRGPIRDNQCREMLDAYTAECQASAMLHWLPKKILNVVLGGRKSKTAKAGGASVPKCLGHVEVTPSGDEHLVLPIKNEKKIVALLDASGFPCIRDDDVVNWALGKE